MNKIFDKIIYKEGLKMGMPSLTEQELDERVDFMAKKYDTVKHGENVIHLEYYDGIITSTEIAEIENSLKEYNLELSRFDKSGNVYASVEDFNLHIAIFLSDPIVQTIIVGLGTNALWDTIKQTAFFIWKKVKQRNWDRQAEQGRKSTLNFGVKIKLDKNTYFDFKIDGNFSEELVIESLDKAIDFLKSVKRNEAPSKDNLYIFDKQNKSWKKVDVMHEMRKKYDEQREKKNEN